MSESTDLKLTIIIVSYNTKNLTLQALESVARDIATTANLKNKTEIIVIDNHSKDDSVAAIEQYKKTRPHGLESDQLIILPQHKNLGFATANNLGIERAKGEYILLLNSDAIVQKGALDTLLTCFDEHPPDTTSAFLLSQHDRLDRLGILAATLLNQDGTLQPQGGSLPSLRSLFCHMSMLDDIPLIGSWFPSTQHTGLHQTEQLRYNTADRRPIQRGWVGGTAMMVRKALIDEVGNLDDNIFMYGEDVEFCIRAKHHHWDIAVHPLAKVIHYGSASSTPSKALQAEFHAYQYIWAKHYAHWQMPLVNSILLLGALLRWLLFTLIGQKEKAAVYQQVSKKILLNR